MLLRPVLASVLQPILSRPYMGGMGGWSPAQLFAAGEQGAWYDPGDLATMFQDSAGTTPVTAAGQPVGKINDKSGRGNHATQATAAARPVLQQDGVTGKFYLQFDGVDDFMKTGAIVLSQPLTKYARWATTTSPVATARIMDGSATNNCAIYHPSTLGVNIIAGAVVTSGATAVLNTYANVAAVFNGVSSVARVNATSASGDAGANASSAITLGASGGGVEFNAMRLASAIVVAAAHTTPTIDTVFAYMSSRTT